MKSIYILITSLLLISISACDEDLLNENALDFYTPENSYTSPEAIEAALFAPYNRTRQQYDGGAFSARPGTHFSGTDFAFSCRDWETTHLGDYQLELTPSSNYASDLWNRMYNIINDVNVVLDKMEAVEYESEDDKNAHRAEARFFRAWAYRHLVHIYGGVPLVVEEISSPRRDFVRATKEEVLQQAIADLEFAAMHLPGVDEVDAPGRVNNAAANHLLAELYISTGEYGKSIAAADAVINDPNIELMTSRFGVKAGEDGDPYWDLFQRGNLNRESGNKESIWVLQTEFNVPGGYSPNSRGGSGLDYPRSAGPLYWFLEDPDGERIVFGMTQDMGWSYGYYRPTGYFANDIWGNGNFDVDLRNHSRNIRREFNINNPASAYFGQSTADLPQAWRDNLSQIDTMNYYFPLVTKITTLNDFIPEDVSDPETGALNNIRWLRNNWYLMRAAETYLLRAEAKFHNGDVDGATADINIVRARANALPATVGEVDLDYILDERMRELSWEENRRNTLARLGLVYERTKMANPIAGPTIQPFNNLFPIPFSEIERNTQGTLEQNPGYTN